MTEKNVKEMREKTNEILKEKESNYRIIKLTIDGVESKEPPRKGKGK